MVATRALIIALLVFSSSSLWAAKASLAMPWASLNLDEQRALAPAQQDWGHLTSIQKTRLVRAARHYDKLSPDEKMRFQKNVQAWTHLPQAARDRARRNYKKYHALPPEKRAVIKSRWRAQHQVAMPLPASHSDMIPSPPLAAPNSGRVVPPTGKTVVMPVL